MDWGWIFPVACASFALGVYLGAALVTAEEPK